MTRVAVVANPTRSGDPYWSRRLLGVLDRAGLPDARWLPTTAEDPGPGQARRALADGAELVVVAGGDGTVRSVGTVLAGTSVPMALLPSGTGTLLARNLGIPLEVESAARVAASGRTTALDVGRACDGECFLVMAGTGFDAAMLRDTSDRAKVWLSWAAYVAADLRHLRGPLATYDLELDGLAVRRQGRGVLVGNVAELQSGLELLLGAQPDDGLLDVAVLGPRTWREWVRLARRVAIGRAPGEHVLERWTARSVTVRSTQAQPVQYDGDLVDSAVVLRCRVEPGRCWCGCPPAPELPPRAPVQARASPSGPARRTLLMPQRAFGRRPERALLLGAPCGSPLHAQAAKSAEDEATRASPLGS